MIIFGDNLDECSNLKEITWLILTRKETVYLKVPNYIGFIFRIISNASDKLPPNCASHS